MELKLTKTLLSKKTERKSFLVAMIGLAFLAVFFGADQRLFSASGENVFIKHEYWRLFTANLIHADHSHLAHNAFFFMGLSALLYNYFGLLVFPFLSFLAGGLINLLTLWFYPPEVTIVGVSGVIYFMAAFWLTLYLFIEKRQKILTRIVHAGAVSLIFFFPETYEAKVSYLCHGFGFMLGLITGIVYYLILKNSIRAKDEWEEIIKDKDIIDDFILLDPNSFHQVQPEEHVPSPRVLDSVQSRLH